LFNNEEVITFSMNCVWQGTIAAPSNGVLLGAAIHHTQIQNSDDFDHLSNFAKMVFRMIYY